MTYEHVPPRQVPPEPLVHKITQAVCAPYRESGSNRIAKWENHDRSVMNQWIEIDLRVRQAIEQEQDKSRD